MVRIDPQDPIFAFSAEQTCHITGVPEHRLRAWDKSGAFRPSLGEDDRRRPFSRVYSFRDVIGLRAACLIQSQVSGAEINALGAWLREHADCPWSELAFQVSNGQIVFIDPASQQSTHPRQTTVRMQDVVQEVAVAARRMLRRDRDEQGVIEQHRFVLNNASVVAGTRIPSALIERYIRAGYSEKDVIQRFPRLTYDDVSAAIEHGVVSLAPAASIHRSRKQL